MVWLPEENSYSDYSFKEIGLTPQKERNNIIEMLKSIGFKNDDISDEIIRDSVQTISKLLDFTRLNNQTEIEKLGRIYQEEGRIAGISPIDLVFVKELFKLIFTIPDRIWKIITGGKDGKKKELKKELDTSITKSGQNPQTILMNPVIFNIILKDSDSSKEIINQMISIIQKHPTFNEEA